MDKGHRIRIYGLHAWSGITMGLFLFVVSFTGCLALFERELLTWEDPRRLVVPDELTPVHGVIESWIVANAQGKDPFSGLITQMSMNPITRHA